MSFKEPLVTERVQLLGYPEFEIAADFPPTDGWAQILQLTTTDQGLVGGLQSFNKVVGLGVGAGHQEVNATRFGIGRIVGVEYDPRRLEVAKRNFERLGIAGFADVDRGDAVEWINRQPPHAFRNSLVLACLPQVPSSRKTLSEADRADLLPAHREAGSKTLAGHRVSELGLALVVGSLDALRSKVNPDTNVRARVVLSNRVPTGSVIEPLFKMTGWKQVGAVTGPVFHDPDTSAEVFALTDTYDEKTGEGGLFFTADGEPMSAVEAEQRRVEYIDHCARAAALGVEPISPECWPGYPCHNVTVYDVVPDPTFVRKRR